MLTISSGIRFSCQRCGRCCTGASGTIYVQPNELASIATFLGTSRTRLKMECMLPFRAGYTIREKVNGDCLFYSDLCLIYPVRPQQCRSFPFWKKNLRTQEDWEEVQRDCPGIGQGPLYTPRDIERFLSCSPL